MSQFLRRNRIDLPLDLIEWIRSVFARCNSRVTEKLSMSPNVAEESLDLTWIEHLSLYSSPVAFGSGWTVKVESHFLGGRRHFEGRWEIADIGVLVFIRLSDDTWRQKVRTPTIEAAVPGR